MKNNTSTFIQDEREIQNNDKALAGAGAVSMLCDIILLIWGFLKDNMIVAGIGTIQLIIMGITIAIIKNKKDSLELPKTIGGKTISTEMTSKGRLNRISYSCLESLFFAVAFVIIDIISEKNIIVSELASEFVVLFIVSFIIEFVYAEYISKKYNKLMAQYEADDDE
jgi:predicted site-specific integrase-resolvase